MLDKQVEAPGDIPLPRAMQPAARTGRVRLFNWKRSIEYHANSVEKVSSIEEIQGIVTDTARYPSPVRVRGSHHSTTRCVVAEGGTVIDITRLNRILKIDKAAKTITMQAGVLHIDAAKALEKEGLQFFVNVEIGNLTVGSGSCCGTKDASYYDDGRWEFGQVCSYCIGMKLVQPDGSIREVSEESDPDLMAALRTSYGMLGIVVEVTFRVKEISAMTVSHRAFHVDEFVEKLDALIDEKRSIMLYLFPFQDRVVVETRYDNPNEKVLPGSWQWKVRNYVWKTLWPGLAMALGYLPFRSLRYGLVDVISRITLPTLVGIVKDRNSSPADQVIRYTETAGFASYTFSIWAFPRETYGQAIKDYYAFCKEYYRLNGYRTDLVNVGYHIAQDRSALFSYTRRWSALTLDPVATGLPGWEGFLVAYNQFCSNHGAAPLFNQTPLLEPYQVQKAFPQEIETFQAARRRIDPEDRFYTPYFRNLFEAS